MHLLLLALKYSAVQKCAKRRQRDKDDSGEEGASRDEKVPRGCVPSSHLGVAFSFGLLLILQMFS